ncbi:hypothetical protein JCM10450v2_006626 [Rhodotorula kratochvilovae]
MSLVAQTLLYPLHLAVLASLHAVLASSRCVRLVALLARLVPLPAFARWRGEPSPAQDLHQKRWRKLPRHLAVALVPGRGSWTGVGALEDKVDGVRRLLEWCRELGVRTLSVYSETGLLTRHAALVAAELDLALHGSPEDIEREGMAQLRARGGAGKGAEDAPPTAHHPTVRLADLAQDETGSASSSTLVDTSPPSPASPADDSPAHDLTLNLLSRAAGRPRLARLASSLASSPAAREGKLSSSTISAEIDALPLEEPDLLLVLGGSYLRLRGFPPWQLRLTEMFHYAYPTWLPAPRVRYTHLRSALDVYGRAEMRLGR